MDENTNKTRNQNIGNSPATTFLQNLGETWYNLNKSGLPCNNLPQNSVTFKRKSFKRKIVLICDKRIKLQRKCLLLFYKEVPKQYCNSWLMAFDLKSSLLTWISLNPRKAIYESLSSAENLQSTQHVQTHTLSFCLQEWS